MNRLSSILLVVVMLLAATMFMLLMLQNKSASPRLAPNNSGTTESAPSPADTTVLFNPNSLKQVIGYRITVSVANESKGYLTLVFATGETSAPYLINASQAAAVMSLIDRQDAMFNTQTGSFVFVKGNVLFLKPAKPI